jgi:hypothetical protein
MAGTRPAGPIAAGCAVLNYLGMDGYLALAEDAHRAGRALMTTIEATPGLALRGTPDATVCAFGGDPASGGPDTFALGDALAARGGWFFDRQSPPDSLHATVHAGHAAVIDELVADLTSVTEELGVTGATADDRGATYGTVRATISGGHPAAWNRPGGGAAVRSHALPGVVPWSIHSMSAPTCPVAHSLHGRRSPLTAGPW